MKAREVEGVVTVRLTAEDLNRLDILGRAGESRAMTILRMIEDAVLPGVATLQFRHPKYTPPGELWVERGLTITAAVARADRLAAAGFEDVRILGLEERAVSSERQSDEDEEDEDT